VAARLIKVGWIALSCGPRQQGERVRRRVGLDLESGQDTRWVGDDRWSLPVIDRACGRRRSGLAATLLSRQGQAQGWAAKRGMLGYCAGGTGRGLLTAAG
jgi:hypothetical protein